MPNNNDTRNSAHGVVDAVFNELEELRNSAPVNVGVASSVTIIQPGKSGSTTIEVRSTDTVAQALEAAGVSYSGLNIKKQSLSDGSSPMDISSPTTSRIGEGSFNLILSQRVRGG